MANYDYPSDEYMSWYADSKTVFKQGEFARFMTYLPNLKVIDLRDANKPEKYMEYLKNVDSTQNLKHLEEIVIKYINYHVNSTRLATQKQLYLSTYRNFSNSLTSLMLSCSLSVFSQANVAILSQFKKLTDLYLDRPQVAGVTLSAVLDHCPKLKRLNFYVINTEYGSGSRTLPDLNARLDYPTITTNTCLEHLDLYISSLPPNLTQYLTACLPPIIKEMKVHMFDTTMIEWMQSVGMTRAHELGKRLIDKVEIQTSGKLAEAAEKKMESDDQMVKFFKFLDVLKNPQGSMYTQVDREFQESRMRWFFDAREYVLIVEEDGKMIYSYAHQSR